ncbi:hypothetical protein [Planctomicrobium sp. SH527]|uniref:hypothetical protein n=1 Tax=Planctomicrobium sp. SH527 TaxID=3448123 RepID=UPI003F5B3B7B
MKSPTSHFNGLEEQLAEKDSLIAVLTSQLEMAVDRLDRLRRAGADRAQHVVAEKNSSATSSELTARLSKLLDSVDERDPLDQMDRIETGVARLLEMMSERPASSTSAPASQQPIASMDQFWAATKERLLNESSQVGEPLAPARPSHRPTESHRSDSVYSPPLEDLSFQDDLPAPMPITDTENIPSLLAAVETRDNYIQHLIEHVRKVEATRMFPVDWDQLQFAPDNYRNHLELLESALKSQLRQAEIANSLERANLTRERAKIAQQKHQLELEIKRAAHHQQRTPESERDSPQKNDPDTRWKRLFSR